MLTDLRHALTPRRVLLGVLLLIGAALLLPWLPPYAPLSDRLTERYLEAHGRSRGQIEQRTAAERRAAEEARRQQEAEETQRRMQDDYTTLLAQYRRLYLDLMTPIDALNARVYPAYHQVYTAAKDPDFYRPRGNQQNYVTPEDTSSHRACGDPAVVADHFNRNNRRDRNIMACAIFFALNGKGSDTVEGVLVMALTQRVINSDANATFPFPATIAARWVNEIHAKTRGGEMPPPLPELTKGDALNPALLSPPLSPGFAERLIETATIAEKLSLRSDLYPKLQRLANLSARLVPICQTLQRKPCFG